MKSAYLATVILLSACSSALAYDDGQGAKDWDDWIACSADEECVPIHDDCGGWTAVNIQFKAQAESYQDQLASVEKCSDITMEPPPKALCLEQACTLKPTHLEMN